MVEIPSGSSNKYEYDTSLGVFRLDRVLYSAVHYPAKELSIKKWNNFRQSPLMVG